MKLFQALKLKNKLVNRINELNSLISRSNSKMVGSKNYYDSKQLLEELIQHINDLNNLKVAINKANLNIQQTIYQLGETKSLLSSIRNINTTEGKSEGESWQHETIKEYIVSINEKEKNDLILQYQKTIEELQDKIDIYNHANECEIDEKSFLINK